MSQGSLDADMGKPSWQVFVDLICKQIWYASEAYVKAQTLDLVFHKDAVPAAIKAKLGIR